ncbi:MAG: hypothetical protein ACXADB_04065 [Candidatus Hermodarchaeia archaeon]|jgi:hypothetical protein
MSKITKLANKFRVKLSMFDEPLYVKGTIINLFKEIREQLDAADIYEGPDPAEVNKLKSHFDFLEKAMVKAFESKDYSYVYSLDKEVYRTVKAKEAAFSNPDAIYTLVGIKGTDSPVAGVVDAGVMGAVKRIERQEAEEEVYST